MIVWGPLKKFSLSEFWVNIWHILSLAIFVFSPRWPDYLSPSICNHLNWFFLSFFFRLFHSPLHSTELSWVELIWTECHPFSFRFNWWTYWLIFQTLIGISILTYMWPYIHNYRQRSKALFCIQKGFLNWLCLLWSLNPLTAAVW